MAIGRRHCIRGSSEQHRDHRQREHREHRPRIARERDSRPQHCGRGATPVRPHGAGSEPIATTALVVGRRSCPSRRFPGWRPGGSCRLMSSGRCAEARGPRRPAPRRAGPPLSKRSRNAARRSSPRPLLESRPPRRAARRRRRDQETANTATHPLRTPAMLPTASSSSAGCRLRPARMITSLTRPVTYRSASAM